MPQNGNIYYFYCVGIGCISQTAQVFHIYPNKCTYFKAITLRTFTFLKVYFIFQMKNQLIFNVVDLSSLFFNLDNLVLIKYFNIHYFDNNDWEFKMIF